CSLPAVSTWDMTSRSGAIAVVTVLNGAAASSPVMGAGALRVTSSSTDGTSTTTRPRQAGDASTVGTATVDSATAIAVSSAIPIIGKRREYAKPPSVWGA